MFHSNDASAGESLDLLDLIGVELVLLDARFAFLRSTHEQPRILVLHNGLPTEVFVLLVFISVIAAGCSHSILGSKIIINYTEIEHNS